MKTFAQKQISTRLHRLASEVENTSSSPDVEAVHDLRVSIRRFNRAIRAFAQFLPARPVRKIRRRTKALMQLAGAVRDRDVAQELLAQAGVPAGASVAAALRAERVAAGKALAAEADRWTHRHFARKWQEILEL